MRHQRFLHFSEVLNAKTKKILLSRNVNYNPMAELVSLTVIMQTTSGRTSGQSGDYNAPPKRFEEQKQKKQVPCVLSLAYNLPDLSGSTRNIKVPAGIGLACNTIEIYKPN